MKRSLLSLGVLLAIFAGCLYWVANRQPAGREVFVVGDLYDVVWERGGIKQEASALLVKVTDDWIVLGNMSAEPVPEMWVEEEFSGIPLIDCLFQKPGTPIYAKEYRWIPRRNAKVIARRSAADAQTAQKFQGDNPVLADECTVHVAAGNQRKQIDGEFSDLNNNCITLKNTVSDNKWSADPAWRAWPILRSLFVVETLNERTVTQQIPLDDVLLVTTSTWLVPDDSAHVPPPYSELNGNLPLTASTADGAVNSALDPKDLSTGEWYEIAVEREGVQNYLQGQLLELDDEWLLLGRVGGGCGMRAPAPWLRELPLSNEVLSWLTDVSSLAAYICVHESWATDSYMRIARRHVQHGKHIDMAEFSLQPVNSQRPNFTDYCTVHWADSKSVCSDHTEAFSFDKTELELTTSDFEHRRRFFLSPSLPWIGEAFTQYENVVRTVEKRVPMDEVLYVEAQASQRGNQQDDSPPAPVALRHFTTFLSVLSVSPW